MKIKKVLRSICAIAMSAICCVATISPIPTKAAYTTEKSIDFSVATDANLFSTTYGGYSIVDGVFKANNGWANTYLSDAISLTTDKVISFDFCLPEETDVNHQFNVGLTNVSGGNFEGGLSWHFYYSGNHSVELVTLNTAFGNTYDGWKADTVADYYDGQKHTMTITITDKVASFQIDGNDVLKNEEVGMDALYLVFQATSTEYSIDNIKIESEIPEYRTLDVDFDTAADAGVFTTSYGGYTVSDGVFKANNAWANTYLNGQIPLDKDKEISFDFCLPEETDVNHQFNVGLTNVSGSTFTGGLSWHFYYNTTHSVELVTLNTAFGNTYDGWKADTVADYYDGQTHTMTITITDKVASFKIDGNDVLKSEAVGLDAPTLVFQATSTAYSIDNLKIKEIENIPTPPGPSVLEYSEQDIDFDVVEDGDVFATTNGGWTVADGVYKASSGWATTYLNCLVPLNEDKEISFDFCLKNNEDANYQFNFALVDIDGQTVTTDFAGHFYKHEQHGEILTLNRDFSSPSGAGWIGDNTNNYNDNAVHNMIIQVQDGKATIYIDEIVVFENVAVNLTEAFLVLQATSTDTYVDNFKVSDTLTTMDDENGGGNDGGSTTIPTYQEVALDFSKISDGDVFTTNNSGWTVADGVYKANSAWATTYLNCLIPLNEDKEISFDFCLKNNGDVNHQFNFALVGIDGETVTTDFAGHFYHHAQHGELFTLNREFNSPTGAGWLGDNGDNYNDGELHAMYIQVQDGKATIYIDEDMIFEDVAVNMTEAFFILQATSVDSYVDNFKVSDTLTTIENNNGDNNEGGNGSGSVDAPAYQEAALDFSKTSDEDVFATTNGGWNVKKGVYKPSIAWATTYLNFEIPIDENKEISFDFCLKNGKDKNHQFNFGFVDINGTAVITDVAGHFYHHAQHGELLTVNRDFGSPTGQGWLADSSNNFNDGKVHNLMIQVKGRKVKIFVDQQLLVSNIKLNTKSAYFILQATSIKTYVDNLKVSDTLTTMNDGETGTGGSAGGQKYREMMLKFNKESDGDVFATNNGGWVVKNGVYKPSVSWATTYFNFKFPFNSNKEISFDFCLKNNGDKNHQFNLGFVDSIGETVGGGLAGHFFNHAQHGELFTLNRDFGNPVGNDWIADNTDNFNDGKVHHMLIQVRNAKVKFCIDNKVIFQDVKLDANSAYFILQATSTDTYVDNMKLSNTLTDTSKYSVSEQTEVATPTAGKMGEGSYKYKEMEFDFSDTSHGDAFGTTFNGWSVADGVYKPNAEWATIYPNCLIPLDEEKEICFDFCMKDVESETRQFNVAFVTPKGELFNTFLAAHFYQHAQYGELFTLNRDFGNPIGEGWIEDCMDHFNDGKTHSMMIRVKDGMVAFYIDGNEIFKEIPMDAKEAYFVMQFTSPESFIDNFRISDTLTYIPDYPTNNPDPEGDETAEGAEVDGLKETEGKVVLGVVEILAIIGAAVVLGGGAITAIVLKKKRKGKIHE